MQPVQTINQDTIDLRFYWRQMRKRPWLILTTLLICLLLGGIYIAKTRPLYQASVTLLIEREESKVAPFEGFASPGSTAAHYETQYKILQSRALARRVIETLDLKTHPEFRPDAPVEPGAVRQVLQSWTSALKTWFANTASPFLGGQRSTAISNGAVPPPSLTPPDPNSALITTFLDRVQVQSDLKTHMVKVSFKAHDASLAADIANTLARLYIDFNIEMRFAVLQDALDWLQKQVGGMRQQVEATERSLQQYKDKYDVHLIDDRLPGLMQELTALGSSLTSARAERIEQDILHAKTFQASRNGGDMEWMPSVVENELIQRLKSRYADLEHEYAELGRKYGEDHPSLVQQRVRLETMQKKIAREVKHIVEAANIKYQLVEAHELTLSERVEALKAEVKSLNEKSVQYGVLKRDAESNRRLSDLLLNRLKEASMTADLTSGNHIRVVDPAEIPTAAINIRPRLTLGLAGFIGLVLGVGLVAFIGYLDNTLKTPDEAEEFLGLPVVGVIQTFRSRRGTRAERDFLVALESPHSQATEAFKTLRANLLLSYADPPRKVFLVSSPHPHDGKTTVAANLALVMAQAERRVLLVDADLRNPSIHKLFAAGQNVGLSELLLTEAYGDISESEVSTGLAMIPAGDIPPNPSELLGSKRMERFLNYAREHYDTIIIDSPPVLAVSDAIVLSALVDGILLVLRSGATPYDHARHAIAPFLAVHAEALGLEPGRDTLPPLKPAISLNLVMNFLDPREGASYGYYGYHNYYHSKAQ